MCVFSSDRVSPTTWCRFRCGTVPRPRTPVAPAKRILTPVSAGSLSRSRSTAEAESSAGRSLCGSDGSVADELSERRLVADGVQVRVLLRERMKLVGLLQREQQVPDRVLRPAGKGLAAREVVHRLGVLWIGLHHTAPSVGHLGVLAGLVERAQGRPDLPAVGLVRLSGNAAGGDDRRPRLVRECGSLHAGPDVDERAGGRVKTLVVELEGRATLDDDVELLVAVVRLVVLVDDPVAHLAAGPRVDAEGLDAEVVPDRPQRLAPVGDLVDLVESRDLVSGHQVPPVVFASSATRGRVYGFGLTTANRAAIRRLSESRQWQQEVERCASYGYGIAPSCCRNSIWSK